MMAKVTDALKYYLRSAKYWKEKKDYLSAKMERLRSRAEKTTTTYSDTPTFGSYDDYRQTVIADMIDTERQYKEAVTECKNKLQEIEWFIATLDDYDERDTLERHYLHFDDWPDVAKGKHYTERHIHNFHSNGLKHLLENHQKIIENGGKPLF